MCLARVYLRLARCEERRQLGRGRAWGWLIPDLPAWYAKCHRGLPRGLPASGRTAAPGGGANQEEKRAVRRLWDSGDRVMVVRGASGTGKTALLQRAGARSVQALWDTTPWPIWSPRGKACPPSPPVRLASLPGKGMSECRTYLRAPKGLRCFQVARRRALACGLRLPPFSR